jgi:hypothetical protein
MSGGEQQKGTLSAEHTRLAEGSAAAAGGDWKLVGPYIADRAWGTVREDYSADGDAWRYFPFDHAHSRAYRWSEDGLAGLCDREQRLCFALSFWNGRDPVLKERIFGLSGPEGNHGEDAKEYWWSLDATPTYSWLRWRYHYPQAEFPYERLRQENAKRTRDEPEFELLDTGVFDDDRYWQITADYAKAAPDDVLIRIRARNAGPEPAELHILPTLWFRNRWSWEDGVPKPVIRDAFSETGSAVIAEDEKLGAWKLAAGPDPAGRRRFCSATTKPTSRQSLAGLLRHPIRRTASTTTSSMAQRRSILNDAGRRWPAGITSRSEPARPPRSGCGSRATCPAGRAISATPSPKRKPTGDAKPTNITPRYVRKRRATKKRW